MARVAQAWASFRRLPGWVQAWVALVLVPVNLAPLAFLGTPGMAVVAALSVGGMLPNLVLLFVERGFSRAMSLSHLVLWPPLLVLVALRLAGPERPEGPVAWVLAALLVVDAISLVFDARDARAWWRGDRAVA